ncbi:PAS domain S-box protein [Nitrospira sp. M1]
MIEQVFNPASYVFSIYALPTIVTAVVVFLVGLTVFIRERGSVVSWLFVAMVTPFSLWFFGFTWMYCARLESVALWWVEFAYIGVPWIPAAIYHFMVEILKLKGHWKKIVWFNWLLSSAFFGVTLMSDAMIAGLYQYWWGFYPKYGWLGVPFMIYVSGMMISGLLYFRFKYTQLHLDPQKQRAKWFLIGFGIAYFSCVDFLPKLGVAVYPFGYLPILTFTLTSAMTIWRYRLVDLTPAFTAERILDTMRGAVLVVDLAGVIRLTNRATCSLLGYQESELLGKAISVIYPSPPLLELQVYAPSGNWTVQDEETCWFSKTGKAITVSMSAATVADVTRTTLGVVYVADDISELKRTAQELRRSKEILETRVQERTLELTRVNDELLRDTIERKKAEASLRESEERFRLALKAGRMGTFDYDIHANVVFLSPELEVIFGLTPGTFGGTFESFMQFIHPEDVSSVRRTIQESIAKGGSSDFEFRIRKQRTQYEVRIAGRGQVLTDEHGHPRRVTGVAFDVTERHRAEEALRQSELKVLHMQKMEAIGTLAGGIAHDFNNILGSIFGYTDLALIKLPAHAEERAYLEKVSTAAWRAKELVQQILEFSRQKAPERHAIHLHVVVKETLQLLRATLPKTIQIRSYLATESDTILANTTQIHQVLVNLCTNAEHAMREKGGILEVKLGPVDITQEFATLHPIIQPGPHVKLTIRDTGRGIPAHVIKRIFEPFFTTKVVGEGTGMGLSVVHGIITSCGGSILVESAVGQGTTFAMYLPRVEESLPDVPVKKSIRSGKGYVLLVEDEEILGEAVQKLLMQLGYEVEMQQESRQALKVFQDDPSRYDVVITDQTMPHLTGERLASHLLAIRPDLPIILCTGFSHTINQEKAMQLGIRAFLSKPVLIHDLSVVLEKVLNKTPEPTTFE